jgi:glycosyltransferase involved in cell wall biosynthesis
MKVSVAICTWNRAELLRRTLTSICRLDLPTDIRLQVIVADNDSTDHTPGVIREFASRLPLRSVVEPQAGSAATRNRAIESCNGEIVVWTDDDVEVRRDWLAQYVEVFDRTPDASFWGGPIRPKFLATRPAWLAKNWNVCQACYSERDLGTEPMKLSADRLPLGANFAVRTSAQRKFPYDESLGGRGAAIISDDEIDVLRRMLAAGHRGYWVPGAIVDHLIPEDRMTLDYVRRYFVGQGRRAASGRQVARSASSLRWESRIQRTLFRLKYRVAKSPVWLAHWIRAAQAEGEALAISHRGANSKGEHTGTR